MCVRGHVCPPDGSKQINANLEQTHVSSRPFVQFEPKEKGPQRSTLLNEGVSELVKGGRSNNARDYWWWRTRWWSWRGRNSSLLHFALPSLPFLGQLVTIDAHLKFKHPLVSASDEKMFPPFCVIIVVNWGWNDRLGKTAFGGKLFCWKAALSLIVIWLWLVRARLNSCHEFCFTLITETVRLHLCRTWEVVGRQYIFNRFRCRYRQSNELGIPYKSFAC